MRGDIPARSDPTPYLPWPVVRHQCPAMPDQWLNIHGRFAGKVFMAGFSATAEKPFDPPPWLQPGPQTWELRRGSCDARSLVAWAASAAFDRPARRGAEMRRGAAVPQAGQGLGRAASDIGRKASNSVAQSGQA